MLTKLLRRQAKVKHLLWPLRTKKLDAIVYPMSFFKIFASSKSLSRAQASLF
jgi:hypothetical protein